MLTNPRDAFTHYTTLHYITVFSAGPTTTRTGPAIQVSTIILKTKTMNVKPVGCLSHADDLTDACPGVHRPSGITPRGQPCKSDALSDVCPVTDNWYLARLLSGSEGRLQQQNLSDVCRQSSVDVRTVDARFLTAVRVRLDRWL